MRDSTDEKLKVGVALGGGATRGAAHVGVLKAFEEMSIDIQSISGTSIGAYVASLYAFGISPSDITEEIRDLDWLNVSSFSLSNPKFGLLTNDKLGDSVEKLIGEVQIEDAPTPLAIVATNISNGKKSVLTQGTVHKAVMASACVPGVFSPVKIDGDLLVDGGLVENVPISPLKQLGASLTIGVDLNAHGSCQDPEDFIDVLINAIDIALDNATRIQTSEADVVIAPKVHTFSRTDAGQVDELISAGYSACKRTINETRQLSG